ncbi:hypothetical protein C2G38_2034315 [Gigaspora rosea]|uniref:Uncharacterized protein n=1 Tax=Gigaspora rosea TaxID=44941 RepID=A0A397VHQ9_9GLOM|nr:hypothetical protein C2G38_2034315 [Gigaspora rosea]
MNTQPEHNTSIVLASYNVPTMNNQNFEPEIEKENNGAFYHQGAKAESIAEYRYKIRDNSIKPRQFLDTDTEDGIENILTKCNGHSLYKFIDGDDPLRPFIDFDLSKEKFDKIEPKLSPKEIQKLLCHAFSKTCKEVLLPVVVTKKKYRFIFLLLV